MQRQSTLAEGDRALERNGRRGMETHHETQLESWTSLQSGGDSAVNVDEKVDPGLSELTQLWPGLPAEAKRAVLVLCRSINTGKHPP